MTGKLRSGLGASDEQYARLGLKKGQIEQWEDGTRTNGGAEGTYEWWYFDSRMDDGTSLVLVFYTKRMMSPGKPAFPYATLDLDTPDGRHYEERLEMRGLPFHAAEDHCDVRIGPSYFRGHLAEDGARSEYEVYFKNDVAEASVRLTGNVPPWRPETGHIFFGERDEHYFAWLPSVPEGTVEAQITIDGKTTRHTGSGYHDHNWGNINMMKVINHWYWGRARIGDYRVISSFIWGEKKYGYQTYPIFMIATDGRILADDGGKLKFIPGDEYIEEGTGKPVHNSLVYDYDDGETRFRVNYRRKKSINNFKMIEQLKGLVRLGAKLIGFDGAYHRFTGEVSLERFKDGVVVEKLEQEAIWEQMYFGHVRTPA
jgi:hypothetical protein